MFGRFRRKLTAQIIDRARNPYATFQAEYGIPYGFWQDEFVLGFFGAMIGALCDLLGGNRLSQSDKGRLLQDVFSSLSNMNGVAIARRFSDLAHEHPQSDDFVRGADGGEIVTLMLLGKVSATGRDIVERAKKEAAEQGRPKDILAIQMILWQDLFVDPVVDRFGISKKDCG